MTVRDKVERAEAVLVLGSDDDTCSVFLDPVWLKAGETGGEAEFYRSPQAHSG